MGVELHLYCSIRLRDVCRDSFTSLFVSFSLERELANSKFTRRKRVILKFKVDESHVILINKEEIFITFKCIVNISSLNDTDKTYWNYWDWSLTAFLSFFFYICWTVRYLLTYLLTPCSRVLLEKLTSFQLVRKFPAYMEPEDSLPLLQGPATCCYTEPARSSPYPHIPLPEDPA